MAWLDDAVVTTDEDKINAVTERNRLALKRTRNSALSALTHVLSGAAVVQVRPADLPNFQMALAIGAARDWVLADNSVRELTVTEMQAALADGIAQGEAIWQTYTDGLKAL